MRPHEVLGIEANATADQIKTAFRAACLANHPDLAPHDQRVDAERRFRRIVEAHERLRPGGNYAAQEAFRAAHYTGRPTRRYEWASSSRVRLSNTMVAAAISVPLFLGGIYFASTVQGNSASMGRPNGLLQPPVNPYLADDHKPRMHPTSLPFFRNKPRGQAVPEQKDNTQRTG